MYTISEVAKRFQISRSTLLYYESIGLLVSSSRTLSNYRLYSEEDVQHMEQINMYRQSGMALKEIRKLLTSNQQASVSLLENQLQNLNKEIQKLRYQQQVIINLLKNKSKLTETRVMDKKPGLLCWKRPGWTMKRRKNGIDNLKRWHLKLIRISWNLWEYRLKRLNKLENGLRNLHMSSLNMLTATSMRYRSPGKIVAG